MTTTGSAPRARRRAWPWWARLTAWAVALAVLGVAFVAVVDTGSAATPRYTQVSSGAATPTGTPAAAPARRASGTSAVLPPVLAGPTVATYDEHGVTGRDAFSGAQVWAYHRPDATTCGGGATQYAVVLVVGKGGRCDEAVGFDPATGKRKFQRTLEAGPDSRTTVDGTLLISISPTTLFVVDIGSGFLRFSYTASSTSSGGTAECELLDADGSTTVNLLQRCRSSAGQPWAYSVVGLTGVDNKGTEIARWNAGAERPTLLGSLTDGGAVVRTAAGKVLVTATGDGDPITLSGVPTGTDTQVVRGGRGDLLYGDGTVVGLSSGRDRVAWTAPSAAVPVAAGNLVLTVAADGVASFRSTGEGTVTGTARLTPAPTVAAGTRAAVVGQVVALLTDTTWVTFS